MTQLSFDQRMVNALNEVERTRRFLDACDDDEANVVRLHSRALVAYRAAARTLALLDAERASAKS